MGRLTRTLGTCKRLCHIPGPLFTPRHPKLTISSHPPQRIDLSSRSIPSLGSPHARHPALPAAPKRSARTSPLHCRCHSPGEPRCDPCQVDKVDSRLLSGRGPCHRMAPKMQPHLLILTGETVLLQGESDTIAGEVSEWPGMPVCFMLPRSTALPVSLHPSGVMPELATKS
jgi:hypothetical protein